MRHLRSIVAHAIGWPLVCAAILIGSQGRSQPAADAGPTAKARAQFSAVGCRECHGRVGQGGFAPALAQTALPYPAFAYLVRHPVNNMPAYSQKVLSDVDLRGIYDFVKALPGPQPQKGFSMLDGK